MTQNFDPGKFFNPKFFLQIFDCLGKVSKTSRGGGVYFFGGCRPFSPILGGVYMKLNQFGGGLFEFYWNVGGVFCFESSVAKMGGGSTFFIKYGLIIEYICNFFCFFGVVSKKFPLKIFSRAVDLGGVYTEYLHFGGVQMGSAENGGGQHPAPEGRKIGTPPPF